MEPEFSGAYTSSLGFEATIAVDNLELPEAGSGDVVEVI